MNTVKIRDFAYPDTDNRHLGIHPEQNLDDPSESDDDDDFNRQESSHPHDRFAHIGSYSMSNKSDKNNKDGSTCTSTNGHSHSSSNNSSSCRSVSCHDDDDDEDDDDGDGIDDMTVPVTSRDRSSLSNNNCDDDDDNNYGNDHSSDRLSRRKQRTLSMQIKNVLDKYTLHHHTNNFASDEECEYQLDWENNLSVNPFLPLQQSLELSRTLSAEDVIFPYLSKLLHITPSLNDGLKIGFHRYRITKTFTKTSQWEMSVKEGEYIVVAYRDNDSEKKEIGSPLHLIMATSTSLAEDVADSSPSRINPHKINSIPNVSTFLSPTTASAHSPLHAQFHESSHLKQDSVSQPQQQQISQKAATSVHQSSSNTTGSNSSTSPSDAYPTTTPFSSAPPSNEYAKNNIKADSNGNNNEPTHHHQDPHPSSSSVKRNNPSSSNTAMTTTTSAANNTSYYTTPAETQALAGLSIDIASNSTFDDFLDLPFHILTDPDPDCFASQLREMVKYQRVYGEGWIAAFKFSLYGKLSPHHSSPFMPRAEGQINERLKVKLLDIGLVPEDHTEKL